MGLKRWLGLRDQPFFAQQAINLYRRRIGRLMIEHGEDYSLVRYDGEDGFDYEAYREIQIAANKGKIDSISVFAENIAFLCRHLRASGGPIKSVLCHGTRNAAEQQFFRAELPDAHILGTEISDTADQFPMTIRWDFHEVKPEWLGAFDIVFSNSWDHSYDPDKLFAAWLSCLAPGGALVVEWSKFNSPDRGVRSWLPRFAPLRALIPTTVTDPFRVSLDGLLRRLARHADRKRFAEPEVVGDLPVRNSGQRFVVVRRRRDPA